MYRFYSWPRQMDVKINQISYIGLLTSEFTNHSRLPRIGLWSGVASCKANGQVCCGFLMHVMASGLSQ